MKGYLARAIGQAQKPLGTAVGVLRKVQSRATRAPAATVEGVAVAPSLPAADVVVSEPVAQRISNAAAASPATAQATAQPVPLPGLHVQRIVPPIQTTATSVERTVSRVEVREQRVVEEKEVVREVVRAAAPTRDASVPASAAHAYEEWAEPMPAIAEPTSQPRQDYSQLPMQIEMPHSASALPSEARRQVERAVTRVVRERVRNSAPPKTASGPARLEVHIDQINVRVENPPAPQPAPAAAPAVSGFDDYHVARTVSR